MCVSPFTLNSQTYCVSSSCPFTCTGTSLSRPRTCDSSAHNRYTDQTLLNNLLGPFFTVQPDTETTQAHLETTVPSGPVSPIPFSHFTSARGKDTSAQCLTCELRDASLCLLEEETHPSHILHSSKEMGRLHYLNIYTFSSIHNRAAGSLQDVSFQ